MKTLVYFLLFYASIFLISMIPEDNVVDDDDFVEQTSIKTSNKSTSYTEFSDSIKNQMNNHF